MVSEKGVPVNKHEVWVLPFKKENERFCDGAGVDINSKMCQDVISVLEWFANKLVASTGSITVVENDLTDAGRPMKGHGAIASPVEICCVIEG